MLNNASNCLMWIKNNTQRLIYQANTYFCVMATNHNNEKRSDEIIDLELYAASGQKPPKGKKYEFKVDDQKLTSDSETLLGSEILEKAGKTPASSYILRKKVKGNWFTVQQKDIVDLTEPGLEKFKTLPNDQTEGGSDGEENAKSLRRDFVLLEEDEEFLNSLGSPWEAVKVGNVNWVYIHGYQVVKGYNVNTATIAFRMIGGYPIAQLDMVYFYPKLSRADGQLVNCLSDLALDGKIFQQWSRHRTTANTWRPGIDNLSTHYPLVEAWLLKEFEKRPYYAKTA